MRDPPETIWISIHKVGQAAGYIVAGYATVNIGSLGGQAPLNAYVADNDMLVIRLKSNGRF